MAHFPLYIDITGREVLLVGSGHHVAEKEAKLKPFGCVLRYISTEDWDEGLLDPAPAMVILCDRHHPRNPELAGLCRAKHIPVNAVDDPPLCDFQFPALIRREGLTIALSTDGKAPAAGRYLREQMEARMPERTEEILAWTSGLTLRLRARIPDYRERAELLNRLLARAFALGRPLSEEELTALER